MLPVTWDKAVVFAGYSGFLHQLQLASHDLADKVKMVFLARK